MIEIETASRWRNQRRFDRVAALLIGIIAILAGLCAVEQAFAGQDGTRAQAMAARLEADVSAKIAATSVALDANTVAQQQWVILGLEGLSRQMVATTAGDTASAAIGAAQQAASDKLKAAIAEMNASSGQGVDQYTASLLNATDTAINDEVTEQNRQVDIANAAGTTQQQAVLALSIVALAGVLAGVAAVLGSGWSGWAVLLTGWVAAGVAAVIAVGALV